MLSEKFRKAFDECFIYLDDLEDSLMRKSEFYCCAQWICSYANNADITLDYLREVVASDRFQWTRKVLLLDKNIIDSCLMELHKLCYLIRVGKLTGTRAKLFYRLYLPCTIVDTSVYSKGENELPSAEKGEVSCTLIHLSLFTFADGKQGTKDIFNVLLPDVYARWKKFLDYIQIDYDEFEQYWNSVHYLEASYSMRERPKVKNAIKAYRKYKVPLTKLLHQYADARHFTPDTLRKKANPWEFVQKEHQAIIQERGMSIDEELFNSAAYQISRENPTDVIYSIFYKGRDDSPIESALVRSELRRLIGTVESTLIVNPSPTFLCGFDDIRIDTVQEESVPMRVVFAVNDNVVAYLYSQEFPEYAFIQIDELRQIKELYDLVVILARDHETAPLWEALPRCKEGGYTIILAPQIAMSESNNLLVRLLQENQIYPDRILDIPTVLSNSEPRKKMILYARCGKPYAERKVYLLQAMTNESGDYLTIVKEQYVISPKMLLQGITLVQMRNAVKNSKSSDIDKQSKDSRIYSFSKEIKICFNIIRVNGNVDRARAYYRNIHRPKIEVGRTKGKRPGNSVKTERGLRGKTEEEILNKLEQVALYDEYYEFIVADIKDYYHDNLNQLTLKTLWYCCRKELSSRISYDEAIALELFCGINQSLSNLISGEFLSDDLVIALEQLYGQDGAGRNVWLQLNLIFQVAVDCGFLDKNPLVSMVHIVKEESRKRVYLLNAALRKNHFTDDEEKRMVSFLCELVPVTGKKGLCVPRYVSESKWLAGAFALFAGLPGREICPLQWRDIYTIAGMEEVQVGITKHLNSSDVVISNVNYGNKEHFRKIPLDLTLSRMVMERKQYLLDCCSYTEETLSDIPIMLECEPSGRGRRKHQMITRTTVRQVLNKLLSKAEISTELISLLDGDACFDVDLNAQRNDLFASNFRHKAYNVSKFTLGELCHYVGNKGPDTFTRHYCDYGNDFLQYNMARKLYRWTHIYDNQNIKKQPVHFLLKRGDQEFSTGRYTSGCAFADFSIDMEQCRNGSLQVEVDCNHGLDGMIVSFEKEGITVET